MTNGCTMAGYMRVPGRSSHCPRRGQHGGADMAKRTCSVEGCEGPVLARGWCNRHYRRWRRETFPSQIACSVVGCEKPARDRGWCSGHHSRWRRTGDPGTAALRPRHRGSAEERFYAYVDPNGPVAANAPELGCCHLWLGHTGKFGHGKFKYDRNKDGRWVNVQAHRWAYEHAIGPIPEGLVLDHFACDNPPCVNPAHLKPVTNAENVRRALQRRWHP